MSNERWVVPERQFRPRGGGAADTPIEKKKSRERKSTLKK